MVAVAKPTYSVNETATICGFHPESIRRMIREQRLPAERFGGGSYRIRAEVIAEMLGVHVGGRL